MFLPLSELLYLPWAQGVDLSNPIGFVVSVFTLHRTYYLVDVMLLYTVLFLVSPLAFYLLASGKTWLLLGGSFLLWGLFQVFPDYVSLPWPIAGIICSSFLPGRFCSLRAWPWVVITTVSRRWGSAVHD